MSVVAVVGASGFVGSRVCAALRRRGVEVRELPAPRVSTSARDVDGVESELDALGELVELLADALRGADVVINAAGLATATSGADDELFGANSLLPGLVHRASCRTGARFVQVSSAAVQGRRPQLNESYETAPFSPYSRSKALGEAVVRRIGPAVIFRPTSVQGPERDVTRALCSYAASPVAMVASPGDDPTPQVHVANVADALAYVALCEEEPPSIVLQPSECITTGALVQILGGRQPRLVPRWLARALVTVLFLVGRLSGKVAGIARRLEMLWFGQRQAKGWLDGRWSPVVTHDEWRTLR